MDNKNKFKFIMIIVILIIILVAYFIVNSNEEMYEEIYINSQVLEENLISISEIQEVEKIKIHIIGEVNNVGIYELAVGSRIQDAILAAGGASINADLNKVNLAYELEDGQKIKIPSIFDEEVAYIYNDSGENVIIENEMSFSNFSKININKANSEELQKINGVGPSLAEKIITYREEKGKFRSIEDLKNVSGIGEKKYEAIKEYIMIK